MTDSDRDVSVLQKQRSLLPVLKSLKTASSATLTLSPKGEGFVYPYRDLCNSAQGRGTSGTALMRPKRPSLPLLGPALK
jgi:hypothetical protein